MKRVITISFAHIVLLSALLAFGCSEPEPEVKSVRFVAGYKAQANLPLVAVYAAQENGLLRGTGSGS